MLATTAAMTSRPMAAFRPAAVRAAEPVRPSSPMAGAGPQPRPTLRNPE